MHIFRNERKKPLQNKVQITGKGPTLLTLLQDWTQVLLVASLAVTSEVFLALVMVPFTFGGQVRLG